jgi:hypothetical protein
VPENVIPSASGDRYFPDVRTRRSFCLRVSGAVAPSAPAAQLRVLISPVFFRISQVSTGSIPYFTDTVLTAETRRDSLKRKRISLRIRHDD